LITSRLRSGAVVACALLLAACVAGGTPAAADDTTDPTLSITFTPQSPTPGDTVTITATVTPGTNPDSTGLGVNCNLSWAGLGSSSPLNPDATGLVFSRDVVVPSNAVPGERVGSCTVSDDQERSSFTPYTLTIASPATDAAPTITSHTPADGASGVAVDANIGITFSEPVDVNGAWYSVVCDASGTHSASVTGSATAYLLNPDSDFAHDEQCTVSIDSTLVTDQDTNDPPDDLTGTTSWSFETAAAPANQPPTVSAGGPYPVEEGGSVQLMASGSDPEGGPLTYAWDLDNNGAYGTTGKTVTFSAAAFDGPSSRTVGVQVTDDGGATATDTVSVDVTNVPPTATFDAPASASAGFPFTLSLTSAHDPSAADTAAGFTYAFDCGGGYGAFGSASTASCPTSDVGTRSVGGKIQDEDGGVTEYRASVGVTVTFASLCELVRSYATDPKVADDLCAKLAQGEAASTATGHDGMLGAFRNQVDAKVGRGLTADQAAELKLLSMRL
jgi:methionine-rich copper-binding protein CopC